MILFYALYSIMTMIFLYLVGSRDIAFIKDFFYFNPSFKVRRLLYVRHIPAGKITLSSLAMQCLIIITLLLQLLSILGTNILKPILSTAWFEKYMFAHPENPYFQTVFCVGGIFFPLGVLIGIYTVICGIFAPVRTDEVSPLNLKRK